MADIFVKWGFTQVSIAEGKHTLRSNTLMGFLKAFKEEGQPPLLVLASTLP